MSRRYNTRSQGPSLTDDVRETSVTQKTTRKRTTYTTETPVDILRKRLISLPPSNDIWHVVILEKERRSRSRKRQFNVFLLLLNGNTSFSNYQDLMNKANNHNILVNKVIETDSHGYNSEDIQQILVDFMNSAGTKPKRIEFQDRELYCTLVNDFKSLNLERLVEGANGAEVISHEGSYLNQPSVDLNRKQIDSVTLRNELNGVSLCLVQQDQPNGTSYSLVNERHEVSLSGSLTKKDSKQLQMLMQNKTTTTTTVNITEKTNNSGRFYLFLIAILLIACGFIIFIKPMGGPSYWPLSPDLVKSFGDNLRFKIDQPILVQYLTDVFGNHKAYKPLSIHLYGNVQPHSDLVIQQMSKLLFGNERSDRVIHLKGDSEEELKLEVIKAIHKTPLNIFVIDSDKLLPQHLDFLTAALDDHHPQVAIRTDIGYETANTRQSVFVVVTSASISGNIDLEEMDANVKEHLKQKRWPDRLCQRVRNIVPLR